MNCQRYVLPLLTAAALSGFAACAEKGSDTTVQKTETKSTTAQGGTVETVKETKQVGNTLEAKTETKVDGAAGNQKMTTETFIGTVTAYTPGKKIEIMTGEKKTHGFDLDEKGLLVNVDGKVAVGSRVKLVNEKQDSGRQITVKIEG